MLGRFSQFLSKKEKWEAEGDHLKKCIAEHLVQYPLGLFSGVCELKIGRKWIYGLKLLT